MDIAAAKEHGTAAPKQAVVVSGAWADALQLKGFALVELHRTDDAKAAFNEAIALAPLYPAPWSELGNIYQTEKNWPEATKAYEQAENGAELVEDKDAGRPFYRRALRGQAFVLTEQGRLDESEALYRKCLAIDAEDSGAKRELDYIAELRAKGNPGQAASQAGSQP
jgi:tetratricopeptide (TPR) repeat protein